MTSAQEENTKILKGIEPVMEALIASYLKGTNEIQSAIGSIEEYISTIEPIAVNKEAVAAIGKLQKTFSNPNLFKIPEPTVITESKETVKAIKDLIQTVELKPMEVNLSNDFTKLEKALGRIEKLVKFEVPLEDGRVAVKLSAEDLKKIGAGFSFPLSIGTASEDTLQLINTKLDQFTFVDGVLQTTAGSGGGGTSDGIIRDGVSTTIKATVFDKTNSNPLATAIVDSNGDQISSFGGGTQYTEGDTDASITGTALLWEDTSDTLRPVSAAKPLPIAIVSGLTVGLTDTQLRASPVPVSGTFYQATQPISAASLPLPTGAATEATLSALNTKVTAVNTGAVVISSSVLPSGAATAAKQPALGTAGTPSADVITVQGATSMTALKVDGSAVTQPVSGTVSINAIPAGTNAIGKLAANSGVDIGDVDVTSLVPGVTATSLGKAEDAGHTTGDTGVMMLGVRKDTPGTLSGTDLDYTPPQITSSGGMRVTVSESGNDAAVTVGADARSNTLWGIAAHNMNHVYNGATWDRARGDTTGTDSHTVPKTSGGLTTYHLVSAATTNATVVKASAGQVYGWFIYNSNAAARKLVFHNAATTPTAGASVLFSIVIPPLSGANVEFTNGIAFSTGIAITTTTGLADTDATAVAANDLIINLFYK
jgi:hypothetical protein